MNETQMIAEIFFCIIFLIVGLFALIAAGNARKNTDEEILRAINARRKNKKRRNI